MAEYRIITCSCGEIIKVSLSSAGETVLCPSCQKEIEIPSWRELKELPIFVEQSPTPESADANAASAGSEKDRRLGLMLIFGILMIIFAVLTAYNGLIYYNSVLVQPEQWDFYDTWVSWQFLRPGIDTPLTQAEQDWFFQIRELRRWVILFGSIAVFCGASLIFLWIKPYQRAKQQGNL